MEWSKIKSVLIVGLIITNIFLALYLYKNDNMFNLKKLREDQSVSEVMKILSKKNIILKMDKITYYNKINDIELYYKIYNYDEEIVNYLKGTYYKEGAYYRDDKYRLILNNVELIYKKNDIIKDNDDLTITMKTAKILTENFLKSKKLNKSEYYLFSEKIINNKIQIIYKQKYKDFYLDDSYMEFTVIDSGIEEFKMKWFDEVKIKNTIRNVIPPSKALFELIKVEKSSEKLEIISVELGYKLDSDSLGSVVSSGDAFAYWRILYSDGSIRYMRAT